MDWYGLSGNPELFRIDDLLDLSNEELFSSASASSASTITDPFPLIETPCSQVSSSAAFDPSLSSDFTADLCVPCDDVAELEWLSQFVEDSFTDLPSNSLTGSLNSRNDTSMCGRARSKRSRGATTTNASVWNSMPEPAVLVSGKPRAKKEIQRHSSPSPDGGIRRCTHCASEKTPQWRTGPLGPKTLCNACGVRYKSGRLVPEYRPAASPTFVLTQHSNSHRKVMELRRQKEMMRQQQQQQQQQHEQVYRHQQNFGVC